MVMFVMVVAVAVAMVAVPLRINGAVLAVAPLCKYTSPRAPIHTWEWGCIACGKRCRKTSPRRPPAAKARRTLSNLSGKDKRKIFTGLSLLWRVAALAASIAQTQTSKVTCPSYFSFWWGSAPIGMKGRMKTGAAHTIAVAISAFVQMSHLLRALIRKKDMALDHAAPAYS
jgi:hypothetical protein